MKVLESIDNIASKVLPFIDVIAVLLGITRYFACSMPSSTTQPISMYREPVHFFNDNKWQMPMKSAAHEYAGSKGQQPVKWHCSSECKTVTVKQK